MLLKQIKLFWQKFKLMKHSFPESWMRKIPLLFLPADTIIRDGKIVAMCMTVNKRIRLICTHEDYRGMGLASKLIERSNATKTDTYVDNDAAVKMWLKNGFKIEKTVKTLFGPKYIFVRDFDKK